jgi:diguanylate cyclase (GGDEF)-like protein
MRKVANTAYWIYAAGVIASIAVASFAIGQTNGLSGAVSMPVIGYLNWVHIALMIMMATLVYGLFGAMPLLRRTYSNDMATSERTAQLELAAVTDPLTGLYNRRYFEDGLKEYMRQFVGTDAPLALLTLDLDHFKQVNDNFGHDAGDKVLVELAKGLKRLTRKHDIVARTGGEEFCIVAPFTQLDQIQPFAQRICRMVANLEIDVGDVMLQPTISIGVATTIEGYSTSKQLSKASDQQLYRAKSEGRNRVCMTKS